MMIEENEAERDYCLSVLVKLIGGLKSKLTNAQIATTLTEAQIYTPQKRGWSRELIKTLFQRLRHPDGNRTRLSANLLSFVVDGTISHGDATLLLTKRVP